MSIVALGYDFWNPIVWVIAFVVVMAVAAVFRSQGQKKYKKDTGQAQVFLCGEEVPEAEQRQVKARNVYWGFFETLKGYYNAILKPHTGIINDYIMWFIVVVAISIIIIFIMGLVGTA